MTYPQRLDALCAERAYSWRVWEEWRQVSGFERQLYWHGEVREREGGLIAEARDYRPDKVWNGQDGAARLLWLALDQAVSTHDARDNVKLPPACGMADDAGT